MNVRDDLIKAQSEYIDYLSEYIDSISSFLHIHRQYPTEEKIKRGIELREKMITVRAEMVMTIDEWTDQ